MSFDDWLEKQGKVNAPGVALAKDAWKAAQSEVRIEYYKKANWVSINGLFSPAKLREIADTVEKGDGVSI